MKMSLKMGRSGTDAVVNSIAQQSLLGKAHEKLERSVHKST